MERRPKGPGMAQIQPSARVLADGAAVEGSVRSGSGARGRTSALGGIRISATRPQLLAMIVVLAVFGTAYVQLIMLPG